jgi:hypothetical protein
MPIGKVNSTQQTNKIRLIKSKENFSFPEGNHFSSVYRHKVDPINLSKTQEEHNKVISYIHNKHNSGAVVYKDNMLIAQGYYHTIFNNLKAKFSSKFAKEYKQQKLEARDHLYNLLLTHGFSEKCAHIAFSSVNNSHKWILKETITYEELKNAYDNAIVWECHQDYTYFSEYSTEFPGEIKKTKVFIRRDEHEINDKTSFSDLVNILKEEKFSQEDIDKQISQKDKSDIQDMFKNNKLNKATFHYYKTNELTDKQLKKYIYENNPYKDMCKIHFKGLGVVVFLK